MPIGGKDGVDHPHHRPEGRQKKHESLDSRLLELEYCRDHDGDNHPRDEENIERQVEFLLNSFVHINCKDSKSSFFYIFAKNIQKNE